MDLELIIKYSPLAIGLVTVVSSFVLVKATTKENVKDIKDLKSEVEIVLDKLEKKDIRIKDLEQEKIKFTEALDRTYLTSHKAYEAFVQKVTYEKEMLRLETSIDKAIGKMEVNSEKTLVFLKDILDARHK